MGASKKTKTRRKKRISKHVLQAEERRKQTQAENHLLAAVEQGGGETTTLSSSTEITKSTTSTKEGEKQSKGKIAASPSNSSSKTKDPEDAASYLSSWNYDRNRKSDTSADIAAAGSAAWKFNKNTQSWLLRHMYDSDKVSKATFAILVDYLSQGGKGTRCRVEEDAKRRARRYKEWEKNQQQKDPSQDPRQTEKGTSEEPLPMEEKRQSQTMGDEDVTKKDKALTSSLEDASWIQLDDHEKRKEYKRARKVLDSLKAVREEG